MKRQSIALILDVMSVGGIPKAAIPFMDELSKTCDVTLILSRTDGELQELIPENVRVLCFPQQSYKDALRHLLKQGRCLRGAAFLCRHLWNNRITGRYVRCWMGTATTLPSLLEEEFDCAIAYHGMNICQLTRTLFQVKARKKVAWIHGDHPFVGKHKVDAGDMYHHFDHFFHDSMICLENFVRDFTFSKMCSSISHPLINAEFIRRESLAEPEQKWEKNRWNILTVGRLSPEKGQDMLPDVIHILRGSNIPFIWYLVGDGPDRARLEELARQKECRELVFLGMKSNPYPYIRQCDLYVQPSYSEAYSITAFEAATLGKVSVLTDVAGATELLKDGVNTIVVEPNAESIANGILGFFYDQEKLTTMSSEVATHDFSNKGEVAKFIQWLVT